MERGPHHPEGGEQQHEEHAESISEQLNDEQRIQRGIVDALTEERAIDDETARRIASQLHGGQESAVYTLASSGALHDRLESEIAEVVQDLPPKRDSWIDALLAYAAARGEERGPREGWADLTADDPKQAAIEAARSAASRERRADRARLEHYVAAGLDAGDAEALIEFQHMWRQQRAAETAELDTTPVGVAPEQQPDSPERDGHPQPRIYVRCLAAYTNGILHGRWIDANQDIETLRDEVQTMLNASPLPNAEEYAIHDFEGFLGYEPGEYEGLATISHIAAGIAESGRAFALYVEWAGSDEETLGRFDDHYMGRWDSAEDWAHSAGEDFEWERQLEALEIDPVIKPYVKIDYDAFAQDMASQWHIVEAEDGVYVFAL